MSTFCSFFQMRIRISFDRRSHTNESSLRTTITRRIQWGTTSALSQKRAGILTLLAVGSNVAFIMLVIHIQICNESVIMQIERRYSTTLSAQCLAFNRECSCHISPNETQLVDDCLPRLRSYTMRILPVVSSVLELLIFRELITLKISLHRFFNHTVWLMFLLVSIAVAVAMFSTHCYHLIVGLVIFCTSSLLAIFVIHDCKENTMVQAERPRTDAILLASSLVLVSEDVNASKQTSSSDVPTKILLIAVAVPPTE